MAHKPYSLAALYDATGLGSTPPDRTERNRSCVMKDDIVIVGAARTPVGSFNGAFASLPAHELGAVAIKAALARAGVEAPRVSEVTMGHVWTAPGWQGVFFTRAAVVGAAMCSAC